MSRVAKYPVLLPKGVEVLIERGVLSVKGRNGSLSMAVHSDVQVEHSPAGHAERHGRGEGEGACSEAGLG